MTAGVLIRRLIVDPDLDGVTHVMLDEVHERGIEVGHICRPVGTSMWQLTASVHMYSAVYQSCESSGRRYGHAATCLPVCSRRVPSMLPLRWTSW